MSRKKTSRAGVALIGFGAVLQLAAVSASSVRAALFGWLFLFLGAFFIVSKNSESKKNPRARSGRV